MTLHRNSRKINYSIKHRQYRELRPITLFLEDAIYSILCAKFKDYFNTNILLDAFAGTGRFGFFIANKCNIKNIFFVEKNATHCRNLFNKISNKKNSKVICTNFFDFIYKNIFDIVILDPPFQYKLSDKLIKFIIKQNYVNSNTLILLRKSSYDVIDMNKYNIDLLHFYEHKYNQCLFFRKVSVK